MIKGRRSPGDAIPGFDCSTGQAISHTWSEWKALAKGKRISAYPGYHRISCPMTETTLFEVFTEEKLW
jgi:hypothetical protein